MGKTQIGWFVLKADKDFYNEFETAAWYEQVAVKAGKYPMGVYDISFRDDGRIDCHCGMVYASMEGTIVSDNFQSLFCGVPVGGNYDHKKNAGKLTNTSASFYEYSVAEAIASAEASLHKSLSGEYDFELFPEYEVRPTHKYTSYDGKEKQMYGIFRREC